MSRVCKAMIIFGAMLMINVGVASDTNVGSDQNRIGHLCFEETVKVANGVDPNSLSTAYCMRALRHEPLGREDRSAMLYNRGIIQRAQGDLVAARTSFEMAVNLSRTIDRRNLALAEVARQLGDYRAALEQYDLLVESPFASDSEDLRAAVVARQQDADSVYFASVQKAQACTDCHGADGVGVSAEYPALAGRQASYLEHALLQYLNGERQNAVMTAQAALIAEDDIQVLAGYFANLDGQ